MTRFLTGCLAVLLVACKAQEASAQPAHDRSVSRVRAALLAAGDPDSLAAAGLVSWHATDEERLSLVARASAAAPNRKDLAWLHLALCVKVESCEVTVIEARLRTLDPGNAAAWSGSLARAAKASDTASIDALLASMAGAERFDIYWNSLVVQPADAMIRTKAIDGPTAAVMALGTAAALAMPLQPMSNACKGHALEQPLVLDTCRRLATVLRRGDTCLTEMFGTSLAIRLWPEGSPEKLEAVDARRVMRYRLDTESRLSAHFAVSAQYERYLQLLATHRTEQEVLLADITASGLSTDPPPGWRESGGAGG